MEKNKNQITLEKNDLIQFEPVLQKFLREIFLFTSHSLYFPQTIPDQIKGSEQLKPVLERDRLLLPLIFRGNFLGLFVAREIDSAQVKPMLPYLVTMTSLCLDKLYLYKTSITDPLTTLFNHNFFQKTLEDEIELILANITLGPNSSLDASLNGYSATFGIILIDLDHFQRINDNFGYEFGNKILMRIGQELKKLCPEKSVLSRIEGNTFALFYPHSSPSKCIKLAKKLKTSISNIIFSYPLSDEQVSVRASFSIVNFPEDISGPQFQKTVAELARILLEKAKRALDAAKMDGGNQIYSFAQILTQGGLVLKALPLGRLIINLGKCVDAREGQRFLVWSKKTASLDSEPNRSESYYPPIPKGEIAIIEVQDEVSIAEVLFLNDPAWSMESGDRLTLIEDGNIIDQDDPEPDRKTQKNPLTGLYSFRDFLAAWNRVKESNSLMSMALVCIEKLQDAKNDIQGEKLVQELSLMARRIFPEKTLGGRYSLNCLIFYIPNVDKKQGLDLALELTRQAQAKFDLNLNIGLASYPFLNFSRSHLLDNCRKALDHALLLEPPKVACFDSISLNISADRLFAQGDIYQAMEEYKLSLAADENNNLARNSLGICYARLGHLELAKQFFQEIIASEPKNLMARYNYACACLKLNELVEAQKSFQQCLQVDHKHSFSLFRLGQIEENKGNLERAWEYYQEAQQTKGGQGLAPRHLARLAHKKGEQEKAREYLHQSLVYNPKDAYALNLLARIYLESGDDPEVAETLARQSVSLKPDIASFWEVLAQSLEVQGKTEQARKARSRIAVAV
ncbi:diguanylate cyclase domain-containing protein [Desulfovulcanus sp.]